jgi:uncharacterized membrane protein YheB (UPF0754 family)
MSEVNVVMDFSALRSVPVNIPLDVLREAQSEATREQINELVDRAVDGRVPSTELLVQSFTTDYDFTRRVRDWVMESISYGDLAYSMWNHVDKTEIIEALGLTQDQFAELIKSHLFSDRRLSRIIESQVASQISSSNFMDNLTDKMQTFIDQKVTDIADLVMRRVVGNFSKALDE